MRNDFKNDFPRRNQKNLPPEIPRHGGFFTSHLLAIFGCLKYYWFIKRILRSTPHDGRKAAICFNASYLRRPLVNDY